MKKRIVVTGVGPITPIGIGKDAFWEALLAGKNGIERITRFDATNYAAQIAGEVKNFTVDGYIDKKEAAERPAGPPPMMATFLSLTAPLQKMALWKCFQRLLLAVLLKTRKKLRKDRRDRRR